MIKSFLRRFLTYGMGQILQTALKFVLLPFFLRFFLPEEYGVISVLTVILSLLTLFTTGGIISILMRLYYEKESSRQQKELIGATWLWCLIAAGIGSILLLTLASGFSQLLFQSTDYAHLFRLLGVIFIFSVQLQIPYNLFRLENKVGLFVGFSLFSFLADFILKLFFIVWLQRGLPGYFESGIIANILTLGLMLPFVIKSVRLCWDISLFKLLLRLGSPYILIGLAVWTIEVSDRLLLNRFSGEEAVGIYSLAYNFANIFGILLASPVALLMPPFFFAQAAKRSETETKDLLRRTLIFFLLAGGFIYLIIALGGGELLRVLTIYMGAKEKYLAAINLIPIITLAPLLYFLTTQAELASLTIKKPEIMSIAYVIAAALNFVLNLLLLPWLGAMGAAISTAIAYLALVIIFYGWMEKIFPVGYNWRTVATVLLYLTLAFILGWLIQLDWPVAALFVKITVAILVFALLTFFTSNILTQMERTILLTYLLSGRKRLVAIWNKS